METSGDNSMRGVRVGVLGCGRSGAAAARLAASLGAGVCVLDSGAGAALEERAADLRAAGVEVVTGDGALAAPAGFDLVVTSPGVPPDSGLARHAAAGGAPVISEIEFGSRHTAVPLVAVTGTNGKTTTTELVAAMAGAGGLRAVPCGNYGRALCDVVLEGGGWDLLAVEVSSFQLEAIGRFHPRVAVWTNFAPDHLDYHPSVEAYRAAKLRVFENLGAGDRAVVRAGEGLPAFPEGVGVVTFSAFGEAADLEWEAGAVRRGPGGEVLFEVGGAGSRLVGRHNAENAMAAFAAVEVFGVGPDAAGRATAAYVPPPHRCELVAESGGVRFINDSKATNLHALESALRSLDGPLVLIAGGKEKGLDYKPLAGLVAERATAVVTIGEIAPRLQSDWGSATDCRAARGLGEAVGLAASLAPPGGAVLLSPGTSSFDMFGGYEERGEAFRAAVRALPGAGADPSPSPSPPRSGTRS